MFDVIEAERLTILRSRAARNLAVAEPEVTADEAVGSPLERDHVLKPDSRMTRTTTVPHVNIVIITI